MKPREVDPWSGHQRCQAPHEFHWTEYDMGGAIVVGRLQRDESCVSYTLISAGTPDCQHVETFGLPLQQIDIKTINTADTPLDEAFELKSGDWILVRPDDHIAARS